jgi:hypothetical protein
VPKTGPNYGLGASAVNVCVAVILSDNILMRLREKAIASANKEKLALAAGHNAFWTIVTVA